MYCAGHFLATLAVVEMARRRGSGKGRDEEKEEEENGRERGGRRGKGGEGNRAREKERVPTTKKTACNLAMGEDACNKIRRDACNKMRRDACSFSSANDKQDCIESCNHLQHCMQSWMSLIANIRSARTCMQSSFVVYSCDGSHRKFPWRIRRHGKKKIQWRIRWEKVETAKKNV